MTWLAWALAAVFLAAALFHRWCSKKAEGERFIAVQDLKTARNECDAYRTEIEHERKIGRQHVAALNETTEKHNDLRVAMTESQAEVRRLNESARLKSIQSDDLAREIDALKLQLEAVQATADSLPEFNSIECPNCKSIGMARLILLDVIYDIPTEPELDPKRKGFVVRCAPCETIFCTESGGRTFRVLTPPDPEKPVAPKAGDNNRKLAGLDGMRGPRGRRG